MLLSVYVYLFDGVEYTMLLLKGTSTAINSCYRYENRIIRKQSIIYFRGLHSLFSVIDIYAPLP